MMKHYQKSKLEQNLDDELLRRTSGRCQQALRYLINHKALEQLMQFCNVVSIERLGMNDHGRVHTKTAALNALTLMDLLADAGIQPNVVSEQTGEMDDARLAVAVAAYLHDLGMSISRQDHEFHSARIGDPFIIEVLRHVYADEGMVYVMRSYINECIMGHMAHMSVSSVEAGVVLVSDGCDMENGRARILAQKHREPHIGDIHQYSAMSVTEVTIHKGAKKPIEIFIKMKDATGIFQVEQVLMGKIAMSAIKPHIELAVQIATGKKLYYLK